MKKIFWDVLEDANQYRVFRTELSAAENLALMDLFEQADPLLPQWQPMRLILFEETGKYRKKERLKSIADFMDAKIAPVVSPGAKMLIEPLVSGQVEFLPFETPVGPYYGLHVQYVDCLDTSRIKAKYFADGRIMRVLEYAFHWDRLENIHIFRLPELGLSRLFVSDEFKQLVETHGLTGLEFYPVPLVEEEEKGE